MEKNEAKEKKNVLKQVQIVQILQIKVNNERLAMKNPTNDEKEFFATIFS